MTYSHTTTRNAAQAKRDLERGGFEVNHNSFGDLWVEGGWFKHGDGQLLRVVAGMVDNDAVCHLLTWQVP